MGYISIPTTRNSLVITGVSMLALLLYCSGSAGAAVISLCNDCHGMPPKDGARKGNPHFRSHSSATVGSHQKHLSATPLANDCVVCHGSVVSTVDHQNNGIIMAASISGGSYGKGILFNQTSIPVLNATARCSNVSCHADPYSSSTLITPIWGTAAANCTACHITSIAATGPATGSHVKHNNTDCSLCHAGATTSAEVPTLNHADGDIDVSNGYPANVAKHTTASGFGGRTCATASCHANVYGSGTVVTPVWGATAGCSACHTTAIVATGPATGSHAIHNNPDCSQCHTGATNSTTTPSANHADGDIDVSNGYPANVAKHTTASGFGGRTCSTGVCHGTSSPVWGANTANATCTKCHGTPSTIDSNANRAPAIGAHQAHVHGSGTHNYSRELTCFECHNSGSTVTFTNHMNGSTQNVVFTNASTARDNSVTASWTAGAYPNGTCTVYCHGTGMPRGDTSGTARTPSWTANSMTGVAANDCSLCHGNPPTAGTTLATHSGKAPTTSCSGCHTHFNAAGGFDSEANRRLHIDGILQANANCDSCHDYDSVGAVWTGAPTNRYTTPGTWGKNAIAAGNTGWGAHAKHINYIKARLGLSTPLDPVNQTFGVANPRYVCGTCHTVTAANHNDSNRSINFNDGGNMLAPGNAAQQSLLYLTGTNPAYNSGARTCSNLSCHYFTSPAWSN